MNRDEFRIAVITFLERLGLVSPQQPQLKPIPVEQQPQHRLPSQHRR